MKQKGYLLILLFLLPLAPELTAQSVPEDHRSIHLRIFGGGAEPLTEKSGGIRFLDPSTMITEPEEGPPPFATRRIMLPDVEYQLENFPVELEAISSDLQNQKSMILRLDADVDSIRFREGRYNVPWRFEPLWFLYGLNGTRLPERSIACFEVFDRSHEPDWSSVPVGGLLPYRFDSIQGKDPSEVPGLWSMGMTVRDWTAGTILTTAFLLPADPREKRARAGRLYSSIDGRHFRTEVITPPGVSIRRIFFESPERGWGVIDTAGRDRGYAVRRTEDGGKSWSTDSLLNALFIIDALPRDAERAWFLGMEPRTFREEKTDLRLYTGRRDGTGLQQVPWPEKGDSTIDWSRVAYSDPFPELLAAGEDYVLCYYREGGRAQWLRFNDTGSSVTYVPGYVAACHRGPDGTVWMINASQDFWPATTGFRWPWTNRWIYSPYTLLRISADGLDIRPTLLSGYWINDVRFADASTGVVVGGTFLLLTIDGGRTWRFLPYDEITNDNGRAISRAGLPLATVWPNPDTLRMAYAGGYLDLAIDDLPPVRDCGGVSDDEYHGEDIE